MKKLLAVFAFVFVSIAAFGQNLTTVSATNITDLNGTKLAVGQLCFTATDNSDTPISFQIGGGGQALKRPYCSSVTTGVVTSFTVPNPATTLPTGIYYRVTVKDSSTGQEVLRYPLVSFVGGTFNFDAYVPIGIFAGAPLSGNTVTGNLGITGNLNITGTCTGCASGGGSGTVTSFSSGNLSPLFTTSVATATTTPAQTFSLSTAGAHAFLGNNTGSTAAPAYVQPAFTDLSGVGSCAQEPAATGDVTSSGCAFSLATTIPNPHTLNGAITTPKLNKSCIVDGTTYTTAASALADTTNCVLP